MIEILYWSGYLVSLILLLSAAIYAIGSGRAEEEDIDIFSMLLTSILFSFFSWIFIFVLFGAYAIHLHKEKGK